MEPKFWRGLRNGLGISALLWVLIVWGITSALAQTGGATVRPCFINAQGQCVFISAANPLPVNATVTATADTVATATAAAPLYLEGSTSPLSMDLSGNLRTLASVSVTNPTVGAAYPATANAIAGSQGGNLTALTMTGGALDINIKSGNPTSIAATQSGTWTVQPGNTPNSTAWLVTGTGGTFPVTGSVTANAGTNLNTSALALETGGNLATIVTNTGRIPAQGQALAAASLPVVLTAAQLTTLTPPAAITGYALDATVATTNTDLGAPGATACATDTASCSLNQQLQRIAQRLTTAITALGSPFQAGGSIGNTTFAATQSGAWSLSANQSVNVAQINGVTPLMGNGQTGTGSQRVTVASDNTAFAVNAQPTPVTTGGLSNYFVQPTASDNHVVIKAGAGQVYKIQVTNNSATVNYLRLYNATTGFNGCNSATNLVYGTVIPASTSGGGVVDSWDLGIAFATGISICVTSGYATTDTTNATASAMNVNIGYK